MKKRTAARRPVRPQKPPKVSKGLLRVGAAVSVTYACAHVVFVMGLGHAVGDVVAHLSMAVCVIPIHSAFTQIWD